MWISELTQHHLVGSTVAVHVIICDTDFHQFWTKITVLLLERCYSLRNSTKQLNFHCKWHTKIRSAIAHTYWLFVSPIVRPHSTFISPNQPVLEGSNVTLTCTTTAKPHASVTWTNIYTSILSLEVSGKITLLNSSYSVNGGRVQTVSSLMINSMMNSDVKSYICGASNRFGLEEVKTTITIHCK